MFKNILLPVDGSEQSDRAAMEAVKLAKMAGEDCKITVMHVLPGTFWVGPSVPIEQEYYQFINDQAKELVNETCKKITDEEVSCETALADGPPAAEILERAKLANHDLIVMGSQGRGALGDFFLGSVSSKVLHRSQCPVLIVK